jgi:hypothetical protein
MSKFMQVIVMAAVLVASQSAFAKKDFVKATAIIGLLQSSSVTPPTYGWCMARLSKNLQSEGFNCPADPLVTFDCEGLFGNKAANTVLFSSAQLAFVTGGLVNVVVDDKVKIDGFCTVSRLDSL